jgi:uncharacterized membrane protein
LLNKIKRAMEIAKETSKKGERTKEERNPKKEHKKK